MITIKDYIALKNIESFLEEYIVDEYRQNDGFSNQPIEKAKKLLADLEKIINKLESR